jgi:hypothetical protein
VTEGLVRHLGVSEITAEQLAQAAAVHPITAVEFEWSLLWREAEHDLVPAVRALGIGLLHAIAADARIEGDVLAQLDVVAPPDAWVGDRHSFAAPVTTRRPRNVRHATADAPG